MGKKYFIAVGPESSGKSTLISTLAKNHNLPFVPEYARTYLDNIQRSYVHQDLEVIGNYQENEFYRLDCNLLLCDTDLITLRVWELFAFPDRPSLIETKLIGYDFKNRYYCLMNPDIPWEADSQREHPHLIDRQQIFDEHERLLFKYNANYRVISGIDNHRYLAANSYLSSVIES